MMKVPVIARFEDIAKKYPNNIAIITEKETVNYAELDRRANQLANCIQDSGVEYNNAIGICLPTSIDMVVSVLAIQKLGMPYVPIDVSYPRERIEYMIHDAKISCLLTLENLLIEIGDVETETICLNQIDYLNGNPKAFPSKKNDIAYILYTSGSTGKPKGVEVYQKGLANYLEYSCDKYLFNPREIENPASFVYLPLAFDASVTSLYTPLMAGRSIVIPSMQGLEVFNDLLIQNNNFDFVKLTPAHLYILKEQMGAEKLCNWTKNLIVGGEALTMQHLFYFQKLNLDWTLVNEYGPTETVVGSTTYFFSLRESVPNKVPIGKPIYNTTVYIVDKEGNIVSNNEIGEIIIGGAGVAKGYHNKEQLTREKFIDDFLVPGNRVYKTGDLGMYQNDGEIIYCGRIDDQVKIRGYRIELADIEAGLKKIPGITEAAAIVKKSSEDVNAIEAFYTCATEMDINEIQSELCKHLPSYMLPTKYTCIEKMPLTPNGKIDRKVLEIFETAKSQTREELNYIEKQLFTLWSEVLNTKNIKSTDKFSVLGGHSLLAVMLIAKINKEFSVKLPILSLYPNGTLRDIAIEIERSMQN